MLKLRTECMRMTKKSGTARSCRARGENAREEITEGRWLDRSRAVKVTSVKQYDSR